MQRLLIPLRRVHIPLKRHSALITSPLSSIQMVVKLEDSKKEYKIKAPLNKPVYDALTSGSVPEINHKTFGCCRGKGTCGSCIIRIKSHQDLVPPLTREQTTLIKETYTLPHIDS